MPPPEPRKPANWSPAEIEFECARARADFRLRRLDAPKIDYENEFDAIKGAVEFVIAKLPELTRTAPSPELLAAICANPAKFTALRYLLAPPISEDDLDTLLDTKVSPTAIRKSATLAADLSALIKTGLDTKRFPWLKSDAKPAASAVKAANLATTVAAAIQRVQTRRRGDEREHLEGAVQNLLLIDLKFIQAPAPKGSITLGNFRQAAPKAGEFMRGATLGADNGDFVIGLPNNIILAIECKSSNSEINSRKRLNKEVVKNANGWTGNFGKLVIAGAALRGVFKPQYVITAQETPVAIFWGHRLSDLAVFIRAARP